jgi:hypothetical protein
MNRKLVFAALGALAASALILHLAWPEKPTSTTESADPSTQLSKQVKTTADHKNANASPLSEAKPNEPSNLNEQIAKYLAGNDAEVLLAHRAVAHCIRDEELSRRIPSYALRPECRELKAEYRRDYVGWIERLAAKSTPGAAAAFLEAGPNGRLIDLTQRPDDLNVVAWKSRAVELLTKDANMGRVDSARFLANAYAIGSPVIDRDLEQEAVYLLYSVELTKRGGGILSASDEDYAKALTQRLNPTQRKQVTQKVAELLKNCCTTP